MWDDKIKNVLDVINSRLGSTNEKTSEFEDKETIQNKMNREKNILRNNARKFPNLIKTINRHIQEANKHKAQET